MNKETLLKPLKKRALPVTGSTLFFIISTILYIFNIEVSTEEKRMIASGITGLSAFVFSGRNFFLLHFEKNKKGLETIITRMNEKDERENFNNKFPSIIRKEVANILEIKNLENEELKEKINKGVEKSICIFLPVLTTNFNTTVEEIKTILLPKSLNLEVSLLKSDICPEQRENFAAKSANITLFAIEDFILGFSKLQDSDIKNGVRRRSFGDLCVKMVTEIVSKSIEEFKNCKKR